MLVYLLNFLGAKRYNSGCEKILPPDFDGSISEA